MLEAHGAPGRTRATASTPASAPRVAWKTGTSYGYRDAWALGVTARYTVGVWVGRPDGTPMPGQYGAVTALPLLFALVDSLPRGATDASRPRCRPASPAPRSAGRWAPRSNRRIRHCARASARPGSWTRAFRRPWSTARTLAATPCAPGCWWTHATGTGSRPAARRPMRRRGLHARWPALATPWLDAGERSAAQLPPLAAACMRDVPANDGSLRITGVHAGARVRQAPGSTRTPLLELHALGASGEVAWLVNGRLAGRGAAASPLRWRLGQPGAVTVVALDDRAEPLPQLAIPLGPGDAPVHVDLQPLFDRSYEIGKYAFRVRYDGPVPKPAPPPAVAEWVRQCLCEKVFLRQVKLRDWQPNRKY